MKFKKKCKKPSYVKKLHSEGIPTRDDLKYAKLIEEQYGVKINPITGDFEKCTNGK